MPTDPNVAASLLRLADNMEVLLVMVDAAGEIQDVRKAPPSFLAAQLAVQTQKGDLPCKTPANDGRSPWLLAS